VKYILALGISVAALLLNPAMAAGQGVHTECLVYYIPSTNTVVASASTSSDYSVAYYYSSAIHVDLYANSQLVAFGDGSTTAQASASGQQETDFWAYANSYITAYFSYFWQDPYCLIDPWYCWGYGYYGYWMYYDAFNFTTWGPPCYDFRSIMCTGYGPATYYTPMTYSSGAVSNVAHVPASCPDGEDSIYTGPYHGPYLGQGDFYGSMFIAQLTDNGIVPSSGKYANRHITESFQNMQDHCFSDWHGTYYLPSPIPLYTPLTVDSNNKYGTIEGPDLIAAAPDWINYYIYHTAGNGCYAEVTQIMSMSSCTQNYESGGHQQKWQVVPEPANSYTNYRSGAIGIHSWPW
jgi:hypothetical protein